MRASLANENKNYQAKLSSFDNEIRKNEEYLASINEQDRNLLDTVATVRGTVSFNWISLWEIVDLYLPGSLVSWGLIAAAVIAYLWQRRSAPITIP